jgi:hypothetical protein
VGLVEQIIGLSEYFHQSRLERLRALRHNAWQLTIRLFVDQYNEFVPAQ